MTTAFDRMTADEHATKAREACDDIIRWHDDEDTHTAAMAARTHIDWLTSQIGKERDVGYQSALDDVLKGIADLRGDAGIARLVSSGRGEFKAYLYDDEDFGFLRDDEEDAS